MSFGLNRAEVIGRLGADVTVNHLASGGRVANLSIATDEGYIDKQTGERVDKTEWHRVVTFQPGLVDMFEKHATKGRLIYVAGKLQTRRWKKDEEDADRFSTEILLAPGGAGAVPRPAQRQRGVVRGSGVRCFGGHQRHSLLGASVPPSSLRAGASRVGPFLLPPVPSPLPAGPRASATRGASPSGAGESKGRPVSGVPRPSIGGPSCRIPHLPPPRSPPRSESAPRPYAGVICPREGSRAGTGSPAISKALAAARSSSACTVPGSPGSGPTRPPESTATCSISSNTDRARPRFARRSPRPGPSSPCRLHRRRARATTQRKRPAASGNVCRAIDGTRAEAYLRARSLGRCRFPALRFHPELSLSRRLFPAPFSGAGRRRDRRRRRHPRRAAHLARSRNTRQGERGHAPQGPRPDPWARRALRPSRYHAPGRGGHRDRAVHRHPRFQGSFRRPRSRPEASAPSCRLPGSNGSSSPGTTISRGAGRRTPGPALRQGRPGIPCYRVRIR